LEGRASSAPTSAPEFGVPGIFTNVQDGLVLVRLPDLKIVLFNPAASDLTGIAEEEALKRTLDQVFPAPDVLATVRECAEQPVGEWPGHDQESLQTHVPGQNGTDDLDVHFCRIEDVGVGGPLVLLVLRPAVESHLGKAIRQGRHARRRVGELETDVENLESDAKQLALHLSEATHEFNTPLTVIALQAQLLRRAIGTAAPAQDKALRIINANVHRLVRLAQDLTDLSRAGTGRLLASADEVDMGALVKGEVTNFQALAAEKDITLAFTGPEEPIAIMGDPARLRQVLGNFLGNAIKFTPRKGKVAVTVAAADGGASVEVSDTGPGMTAEDMARLFQPFVRIMTPGVPKEPGTGLGLHISKRIVEAHGGEVGCASDGPGKGMTFWFKLPLSPPTGAQGDMRTESPRRPSGRPSGRPAPSARRRQAAAPVQGSEHEDPQRTDRQSP
jgi:signal transduction histidine kinase